MNIGVLGVVHDGVARRHEALQELAHDFRRSERRARAVAAGDDHILREVQLHRGLHLGAELVDSWLKAADGALKRSP